MASIPQTHQGLLRIYKARHGTFKRLRGNELSITLLSRYTGTDLNTLYRAIDDGRLRPFIRRTVQLNGQRMPIFAKRDLPRIRKLLQHRNLPLGAGELSTGMLARRLGTATGAINFAVVQGKLDGLIARNFRMGPYPAHVFRESDLDAIDLRLFTERDDITNLAEKVELNEFDDVIDRPLDPEELYGFRETKQLVRNALGGLPRRYQRILIIYFDLNNTGEDRTMEEIAQKFALTRAGVQHIIHQSLKTVRIRLTRQPL